MKLVIQLLLLTILLTIYLGPLNGFETLSSFYSEFSADKNISQPSEYNQIHNITAAPLIEEASHTVAEYSCLGEAEAVTAKKGTQIYTWVDESGVTQFSDRAPAKDDFTTETLESNGKDYFDLKVEFVGIRIPPYLNDHIDSGGRAIYSALEAFFPAQYLVRSDIDVAVYSSEPAYQDYRRTVAPALSASVTGFYSGRNNKVSVLYKGDDESVRRTSLHEITHAIQAKQFARAGGWFTEGYAEYFEQLEIRGNSSFVPVNAYYVKFLRRHSNRLPMSVLLTADYDAWKSDDRTRYYANAWALAYYLMTKDKRQLSESYLTMLAQDRCSQVDNVDFFRKHYSGGIGQLQQDVTNWLYSSHNVPNYH